MSNAIILYSVLVLIKALNGGPLIFQTGLLYFLFVALVIDIVRAVRWIQAALKGE